MKTILIRSLGLCVVILPFAVVSIITSLSWLEATKIILIICFMILSLCCVVIGLKLFFTGTFKGE
jgi:hypothetical protein